MKESGKFMRPLDQNGIECILAKSFSYGRVGSAAPCITTILFLHHGAIKFEEDAFFMDLDPFSLFKAKEVKRGATRVRV